MDYFDELLNQLSNEKTATEAAFHLAEIPDQRAFEGLVNALKNENSFIRNSAVLGLANRKDSRAVSFILDVLNDADIGVRASAAFALGKLGNSDCIPNLSACLRESINVDAHLSRQLIVALTDICGGDCSNIIAIGLESSIPIVRSTTAEFLGQIGNKDIVTKLSEYLFSETDQEVRKVIQEALSELKGKIPE